MSHRQSLASGAYGLGQSFAPSSADPHSYKDLLDHVLLVRVPTFGAFREAQESQENTQPRFG